MSFVWTVRLKYDPTNVHITDYLLQMQSCIPKNFCRYSKYNGWEAYCPLLGLRNRSHEAVRMEYMISHVQHFNEIKNVPSNLT